MCCRGGHLIVIHCIGNGDESPGLTTDEPGGDNYIEILIAIFYLLQNE